ncbi:MAG: hypothetical protein ABI621_19490 [Chloroflexota bacterium]
MLYLRTRRVESRLASRRWHVFFIEHIAGSGNTNGAIEDWRKALSVRPGYEDALYALSFVGATP